MTDIGIVSASAGSGKTFHLATLLEREVGALNVRADAIVATTFTNKAAAELQERVRTFLLQAGRFSDAQMLAASRIGTVNSVCGQLVTDFAFELGLSPRLAVLDEARAQRLLGRALSNVLTGEHESAQLAELSERLGGFDWEAVVSDIVTAARTNCVDEQTLRDSAHRNVEQMMELLDSRAKSVQAVEGNLAQAIRQTLEDVDRALDPTKATGEACQLLRQSRASLEAGRGLPYSLWLKLSKTKGGKRSWGYFAPMQAAAAQVLSHPRLHDDVELAIRLVFDVAARTLQAYADLKKAWGGIDFVDQERLALQALRRDDVRSQLRGQIDLVLVDEFQDTSPIQLAIFLELAKLAPRSVWVGDQKQSIYAFRGADPALMDAAIDQILAEGTLETLGDSYRSRPGLVELTSEVFAAAFDHYGLSADRVRLKAQRPEPRGMDPHAVEVWRLHGGKKEEHAMSVADGVRRLLADKTVTVEDRGTKQVRPVAASDVAVLCRENDTCARVARELSLLGIRAELPTTGIASTLHGLVALSGLALWVDARDSLALANVARIIDYADRPDEFLAAALAAPKGKAFEQAPWRAALRTQREANPSAGPVAALDAVYQALDLRELCLSWPESERRLADLDRLRGHALAYSHECLTEGAASTPAGFLAYMAGLAGDDARALATGGDAVTVSTWHSAKGLEWPVVVLNDVKRSFRANPMGKVSTESESPSIDLEDPLKGRWIRFWPSFFGGHSTGEFFDRLGEHPLTEVLQKREDYQHVRLQYVGWTRARDRLVLASVGPVVEGQLSAILGVELEEPETVGKAKETRSVRWGQHELEVVVRVPERSPPRPTKWNAGIGYDPPRKLQTHAPAFAQPSAMDREGTAGASIAIGPRLPLKGQPDMAPVGEAVHAFLAADLPGLQDATRTEMARELLSGWDVAEFLEPSSLLQAGNALRSWIEKEWPAATWRREWPVAQWLDGGTVLGGRADLVLELDDAVVVVDHKSFPGTREQGVARAAHFAGQLRSYGEAVSAATGKRVTGTYVHLPVLGVVVPVEM